MAKISLNDVTNGYNLSAINDNFQRIAQELNNKVLYRDNPEGEPNALVDNVDMNSQRILNLPDPVSGSEPATRSWIEGLEGSAAQYAVAAAASAAQSAASASASAASATASNTSAGTSLGYSINSNTFANNSQNSANQAAASAAALASFTYRGNWLTATAYTANNFVHENSTGSSYICIQSHTSGTFSTDLSNGRWGLLADKGSTGGGAGDMISTNNLSELSNKATARSNLQVMSDVQVRDNAAEFGGVHGGTANAMTIFPSFTISAYANGQRYIFIKSSNNSSSTVTLSVSGLAAIPVLTTILGQPAVNDLVSGRVYSVVYASGNFVLEDYVQSEITAYINGTVDQVAINAAITAATNTANAASAAATTANSNASAAVSRLDSITGTNLPAFHYQRSTNQTSGSTLIADTAVMTNGGATLSSGVFTAPRTGMYIFSGSAKFGNGTGSYVTGRVRIIANGIVRGAVSVPHGPGTNWAVPVTGFAYLTVGQTAYLEVTGNGGSVSGVYIVAPGDESFFSGIFTGST